MKISKVFVLAKAERARREEKDASHSQTHLSRPAVRASEEPSNVDRPSWNDECCVPQLQREAFQLSLIFTLSHSLPAKAS